MMLTIAIASGAPSSAATSSGLEPEDQREIQWVPVDQVMPIIRGQVEPAFDSVVALSVGPFDICSGNMITPRVVLAAAHCGAGIPADSVAQFGSAVFGSRTEDPQASVRFTHAAYHPLYFELDSPVTVGGFDLAIAVLEEDAPVEPIRFRTEPLTEDHQGTELVSVGFGIDENGVNGIKRSAVVLASEIHPMFVLSESDDNPDRANICSGDSGGPQFAMEDGVYVQWSVHSWADQACEIVSGSTRTDVGSDWILDEVELVHGSRDLCEINGRYGDAVCDRSCPLVDVDCVDTLVSPGAGSGVAKGCSVNLNSFCAAGFVTTSLNVMRRRPR